MRPSLYRDLTVLLLVVTVCRAPAFASPAKPKPAPRSTVIQTFTGKGYGVNEGLAKKNALDSLREEASAWLLEHYPDVGANYTLTPADVEGMVREYGQAEPWDSKREVLALKDGEKMLQISWRAEMTAANLKAYRDQVRLQLAQQRQGLVGRGLIGAVALLLVGTGYLKLEERVGRHKGKLGIAALGVLGLVGLALAAVVGFDVF